MRGQFELGITDCLECIGIQSVGGRILLQGEKDTIIKHDVSIGSRMNHPFDKFLIRISVSVFAEDRSSGSAFSDELLCSDEFLFEVDMSIADSESYHLDRLAQ